MTTLTHIPDQKAFDVDFSIPVDLIAGVLTEQGDYLSGGSVTFELKRTPTNEGIIGEGRNMIKAVLSQGASTIVGELLVNSYTKELYKCELIDIRTSAFRRLKELPAREVYMDDLNHTWDFDKVLEARTDGWVYPLVDYGWLRRRGVTIDARDFKFDLRNDIFNFRPAMFAFDFIQRAFTQIGWDIELPTGWFRNLVIPNTTPIQKGEDAVTESAGGFLSVGAPTTAFAIVPLDLATGANFNTTTHRYTATSPSMVNYRALVPAFNNTAVDRYVSVYIYLNGSETATVTQAIPAGQSANVVIQGQRYLNTGDYLDLRTSMPFNSPTIVFPGAGSRLEVQVIDSLAFGSTIEMAKTLPNVAAADLVKWILAGTNCVLDVDPVQSKLTAVLYPEFYEGQEELEIDVDSVERVTKPNLAQNNYLSYSGDAYANGGFRISDTRLDRENELFTSGFAASKMGPAFGGLTSVAWMYEELPVIPTSPRGFVPFFNINPIDEKPRLIFIKRESSEGFLQVPSAIQIGTNTNAFMFNVGYFYNQDFSLAYNPIGGVDLATLCFEEYAGDFVDYEEITVLAALQAGEVNGFSFRKLVPFDGRLYRVLAITDYSEGQKCRMLLRRVGLQQADMSVQPRIGTSPSLSTTGDTIADDPVELVPMARIQVGFQGYDSPVLEPTASTLFQDSDEFGNPEKDLYLTIPQTGYYTIFYQVTAGGGDGRQISSLFYAVSDSTDAGLFVRTLETHSHAHNIQNEEFLQAGWRVRFCATFVGATEPDYDEEKTFATITQRATNG